MRCEAKKSDKRKCKANAMHGSKFCFRHDKSVRKEALRASSEGGQARRHYVQLGGPIELKTPEDIKIFMAKTINSLWTGKMPSNNPAGGLGYMAKIFLEAYDKSELEARIELLEKRLDEAKI